MPTPNLRLKLIPQFTRSPTEKFNAVMGELDKMLVEPYTPSFGADITMSAMQALRFAEINLTGIPGADRSLTYEVMSDGLPRPRWWFIRNGTNVANALQLVANLDTTPTTTSRYIPPSVGQFIAFFDGATLWLTGLNNGQNRYPTKDLSWTSNSPDLRADEFRKRTLTANANLTFSSCHLGSYWFEIDSGGGGYTLSFSDATIVQGSYVTDGTVNHIKATLIDGPPGSYKWIVEIYQE